jgi:hypothetical protein
VPHQLPILPVVLLMGVFELLGLSDREAVCLSQAKSILCAQQEIIICEIALCLLTERYGSLSVSMHLFWW